MEGKNHPRDGGKEPSQGWRERNIPGMEGNNHPRDEGKASSKGWREKEPYHWWRERTIPGICRVKEPYQGWRQRTIPVSDSFLNPSDGGLRSRDEWPWFALSPRTKQPWRGGWCNELWHCHEAPKLMIIITKEEEENDSECTEYYV